MNPSHLFPIAALVAAAVLFFQAPGRIPALFAALAAALELLLATGVISLHTGAFPVRLLLGAVLLVAGAVAYLRVTAKVAVSAATVVALVGLLQVVMGLRA
jgi:hypothetical protein